MKTLTLFQAYKLCKSEMSWCDNQRENRQNGILVDNDHYAKLYQRYDRFANKLNRAITGRLAQQPGPASAKDDTMKTNCPINVPEIERLTKEFVERVADVAGIKPDVDVWFHTSRGDTRPLAHDALLCDGYRVVKVPDYPNTDRLSHLSVKKSIFRHAEIFIHVDLRTGRARKVGNHV